MNIEEILKPETELEEKILSAPELIEGLLWGEPRRGHPEGKVIYHVRDVLKNVEKYNGGWKNRQDLRIIALVHDSFKYQVDNLKPKINENDHAVIARRFTEKYLSDENTLQIIEMHDEAIEL